MRAAPPAARRRPRAHGSGATRAPVVPEPNTSRAPSATAARASFVELALAEIAGRVDGLTGGTVRRAVGHHDIRWAPRAKERVLAGPLVGEGAERVSPDGVPAERGPSDDVAAAGVPAPNGPERHARRPGSGHRTTDGPGALLALLDRVRPGPELAATLAGLDESDLDDFTILEVLAAWERIAAWAQAGSARVLAEMLERTRGSSRHEFVADGVAARLGLTRGAAEQHVTVAHGASRLPEVAAALAHGLVDRRKAEVLVSAGRLPDDRRRAAVRELLPEIEHLTVPQIRARMRRAEIEVDPDGAEERHRAARRERFVRLEPVDDAMAYLTAYLPADDAARAFAAVDELAFAVRRSPGEERRLDECRADALVGMLSGGLSAGPGDGAVCTHQTCAAEDGDPGHAAASRGAAPRSGVGAIRRSGVHVTIAASTLLGSDDLPATLARYGPVPAGMARALASDPDAVWQRIFTDPGSGALTDTSPRTYRPSATLRAAVVARDVTCTFPGCRVPAAGCDLDHVEPFDPGAGGAQTHGANLHALCRTHHRAKTLGGWSVFRDPGSGVTTWTAPTGHRHAREPVSQDPGVPSETRPAGGRPRGGDPRRGGPPDAGTPDAGPPGAGPPGPGAPPF